MNKNALLIGTCGIDCFFALPKQLELNGIKNTLSQSPKESTSLIEQKAYDLILINLEPNGKEGISGFEILKTIIHSPLQQNAVCLSVSTRSAASSLATQPNNHPTLSILAGWINLPMQYDKAAILMRDLIDNPGHLKITDRLQFLNSKY